MENGRIAKRIYVGECAGSRSVGRVWRRWINTVNDYLKKRVLDVGHGRRMGHDRICKEECRVGFLGDEPLTLTICHSCEVPHLYEALEGRKPVCGQAHIFFHSFHGMMRADPVVQGTG